MPRHRDTEVAPNTQFVAARSRLIAPRRPDRPMSRSEVADAVNTALELLFPGHDIRALYVDFRWIGKLERGEHRWPARERRAALRHVLHTRTDADLGLFPTRRAPDTPALGSRPGQFPAPLHHEEPGIATLDTAEAWLRQLGALVTETDNAIAADTLHRVRLHLQALERLQHGGARPDLARVDARWSEFLSWLTDNTGEPDGAIWLHRAHRNATAAEDPLFSAYTLMRHSQHTLDGGDVRTAIQLARRALTYGRVPARTHVLCLTRMAEALATCGDDTTVTVVAQARRSIRAAGPGPAEEFADHCDLRYVTAVDARCRFLLGDTTSAATILEELLTGPAAGAFDAGMWHAHLGDCYQTTDPERAAHHGSLALHLGAQAGSYRPVRALQPLAVALRPHRTLPTVQTFLHAHRQAVAGPVPR
ncbi:hypothetical protein ACQP00_20720 [Dactylosporangium sp. CS-047395]|uniref:hypothetical protein n=1 Tax=Dactylosporangium sp. CS-047395 TaxID=3239936 RepID=UPI003D8CFB7D